MVQCFKTSALPWQVPRRDLYVQWLEAFSMLDAKDMMQNSGVHLCDETSTIRCVK